MMQSYIGRTIDNALVKWAQNSRRKPLLLRGARQVGKTTAVRHLAASLGMELVEIDCARRTDLHAIFSNPSRTPQEICEALGILLHRTIIPGKSLLFLDEIQACIPAIESLRYFYESYPELHVVAAGSLLEFALKDIGNFGVGRIHSLFLYPLSFQEFLGAISEEKLGEAIAQASPHAPLVEPLHERAVTLYKTFLLIGGFPEVVSLYRETGNLTTCMEALDDLVLTYQDDFVKYKRRSPAERLREVFRSVARQGTGKFVYGNVNPDLRSDVVRDALELLLLAGIVIPTTHSSANSIPLGATTNPKYRRISYLDTGILFRMLGLDLQQWTLENTNTLAGRGAAAEQFVAAELMKAANPQQRSELYCWHNESKNGTAELDFVLEFDHQIHGIEVKSGSRGSMHSLRFFLKKNQGNPAVAPRGIRLALENFAAYDDILVYPLYAVGNLFSSNV